MKKIVICGGHLTPAVALIEQLEKKKGIEIFFLGRKFSTEGVKNYSAEYSTIKNLNVQFYSIIAGKLQRKFTKFTIVGLLKIPIGFTQSFYFLLKLKPDLIVSFGGYVSLPVVICGWLLGIKSITHEQSVILGLSNKINSFFVHKVYLSWPQTAKEFSGSNCRVIGNLVRKSIFQRQAKDQMLQRSLISGKRLIFITGGNQGSHFINRLIFEILPKLSAYQIIHQVGTANYGGDLDYAKTIKRSNYDVFDYISGDDIGAVFGSADLVVSRSGANTVWDLATLAKVAILIPLPIAASGEQIKNAQILKQAESAIVLDQKKTHGDDLINSIEIVFDTLGKYAKRAQVFAKTLPRDAAQIMAADILKIIKIR